MSIATSASRQPAVDGFDKKEWTRELKQLKKEYTMEDRERYRPLHTLKRELKENVEEFEKEEKKNELALRREQTHLLQVIEKQRLDVDCARTMINQSKMEPSYLDKIHGKVKTIEQNLKNFKLKSRSTYEQLVDEEESLWADLKIMEEKFDQYALEKTTEQHRLQREGVGRRKTGQRQSSLSNRVTGKYRQRRSSSIDDSDAGEEQNGQSDELEDIKQLLEKIDFQLQNNGGINCGWDAADHKDFLRIRTKHNNKINTIAFFNDITRAVPNCGEQEIKDHIQSYDRYLDLGDKKKQLLQEYKEAKKRQQQERVSKIDNQNTVYNRLNADLDLVTQAKENNKNLPNTAEEREKLKQEVDRWKKQKEEQKRKELLEKKQAEQEQRLKLRQKLEDERRQKKEQVEEFKFQKEMSKLKEKQLEELERKKQREQQLNQEQKERIWKREEEQFLKKHQKIMSKQAEKEEREAKQEQLKAKMANNFKDKVESKFNEETKAMKDKKRSKFEAGKDNGRDAMTMGGNLLGVSARAMPFWRQGI